MMTDFAESLSCRFDKLQRVAEFDENTEVLVKVVYEVENEIVLREATLRIEKFLPPTTVPNESKWMLSQLPIYLQAIQLTVVPEEVVFHAMLKRSNEKKKCPLKLDDITIDLSPVQFDPQTTLEADLRLRVISPVGHPVEIQPIEWPENAIDQYPLARQLASHYHQFGVFLKSQTCVWGEMHKLVFAQLPIFALFRNELDKIWNKGGVLMIRQVRLMFQDKEAKNRKLLFKVTRASLIDPRKTYRFQPIYMPLAACCGCIDKEDENENEIYGHHEWVRSTYDFNHLDSSIARMTAMEFMETMQVVRDRLKLHNRIEHGTRGSVVQDDRNLMLLREQANLQANLFKKQMTELSKTLNIEDILLEDVFNKNFNYAEAVEVPIMVMESLFKYIMNVLKLEQNERFSFSYYGNKVTLSGVGEGEENDAWDEVGRKLGYKVELELV